MISYDVRETSTQMIKSTFYRKKLEVVETIYGNSNSHKNKNKILPETIHVQLEIR